MSNEGEPRWVVSCNGQVLSHLPIVSCSVRHSLYAVPWARLVFEDDDLANGAGALSDGPLLVPGAVIEISAFGADQNTALFSGTVVRHGFKINGDRHCRLEIDCWDRAKQPAQSSQGGSRAQPVLTLTRGGNLMALDADVDSRHLRDGQAPVRGWVRFAGNAAVRPGAQITLAGIGSHLNGDVLVGAVQHDMVGGTWVSEAEFCSGTEWHAELPYSIEASYQTILAQDQFGNSVKLSADGMVLASPQNIRLNTESSIQLDALQAITIASKADVKATGQNVACEAAVGFTGKGNATAELSAAGQTTVKGALVMIN